MITEEFVTTKLISWLKLNMWQILCFDFPQSGTGYSLKPVNNKSKNKNVIIPDIVGVKNGCGILFENKDRFYLKDFNKIQKLRTLNDYFDSLKDLFGGKIPQRMYYGIAFPNFLDQIKKSRPYLDKIDFLVTLDSNGAVQEIFNPKNIDFLNKAHNISYV